MTTPDAKPSVLWLPEQHDVRCSARQGGECRHEPGCKPATTIYRTYIKFGEPGALTRSNVAGGRGSAGSSESQSTRPNGSRAGSSVPPGASTASADYPQASIREIALALFVADTLLCDFAIADDALPWCRKVFDSVDTEPYWADGRHEGDCTQQPMTCSRCLVEDYEAKARELAIREGFDVPNARAEEPLAGCEQPLKEEQT